MSWCSVFVLTYATEQNKKPGPVVNVDHLVWMPMQAVFTKLDKFSIKAMCIPREIAE